MNKFTIFYKSGGGSSTHIVDKYWKTITLIFNELSKNEYSHSTLQFHIELRVDGEYLVFGDVEGCNNLRFLKKKNLAAISISFGEKVYFNENTLSEFLQTNLLIAFEQIIKRIEKEKIEIKSALLMSDLKKHIEKEW
jgi:hypothetical protein